MHLSCFCRHLVRVSAPGVARGPSKADARLLLGVPQKSLSCSEEFKELMDLPTFGARNLKKHLAKAMTGRVGAMPSRVP